MGFYVNPPDMDKETWLVVHGQETTPNWPPLEGLVLVCLVDNGPFKAAGICYNESEFYEFVAPDTTPEEIAAIKANVESRGAAFYSLDSGRQRPRTWYLVRREDIIKVCPEVEPILEV